MNQGVTATSVKIAGVLTVSALCAIALFSVYGDITNTAPPSTPESLVENQPPAAIPLAPADVSPPVVEASAPAVADTKPTTDLELNTLIVNWREAWASGNVDHYLSFYADGFQGNASSHEQWEANRRRIIGQAGKIEIQIGETDIRFEDENNALLTFPMTYQSSRMNDRGIKQLIVTRTDGRWLITEELFTPN